MEISSQRIETFDRIAESFSWALSHSRVSIESLGEFATLLYLIKHDQLRKVSNSDCKEGNDLFVVQFGPSMVAGDMEKWMQKGIACIGLMRKEADPNQEIEAILQRYRTTLRQHQSQDALIRTFDLIKEAQLEDAEYTQLLVHVEHAIAEQEGGKELAPIFPKTLGEMMTAMLHYPHKSVYDPFIGTASLMMDFPQDVAVHGNEINPEFYTYAMVKLALIGHNGHCSNVDSQLKSPQVIPATCIVTFPPLFSTRPGGNRMEALEIPLRLFQKNDEIKELVMVVPEHFMISDRYYELRKSLTDANLLDKIVRLPNGYFYGTALTASIIQLRKGRTEEDEIAIGNLAEDAERVGRRREIYWGVFKHLLNPYVEHEENGKVYKYDTRESCEIHYQDEIAKNDYCWSALLYPNDNLVTGIPQGGDGKAFTDIMKPFHAQRAESKPDKVLYFHNMESVFASPEEREPREREICSVITEPVFVIGYSIKCPLYYLEASQEHPVYIDRREILFKCVDNSVCPLYLAYIYSNHTNSPESFGIPPYVVEGEFFSANKNISLFLQAQIVGLPSTVAQEAKIEEAKSAYIAAQIEKTHMNEYVDAIKKQYIEEVRSRKHNMRPYLRKLKSNTELALDLLDEATSLEELKPAMKKYLRALVENRKALSKLVENLSNEDKFGEPEQINIFDWILDYINNYPTDGQFVFDLSGEMPAQCSDGRDWDDKRDGLVEIAPSDLHRLCDCIVENACAHGFADKNGEHLIEIKCIADEDMFEIRFTNNGTPLPEGMDVNTYGRRNGKAGKHAGTGDGGYQVVSIATHYGGYVELHSTSQDEPNSRVTISVFLPVAYNFWFDNSDDENDDS